MKVSSYDIMSTRRTGATASDKISIPSGTRAIDACRRVIFSTVSVDL